MKHVLPNVRIKAMIPKYWTIIKICLGPIQRPKWDEETLPQLGFEIIQIQPCLNAVVYNIQDQMKYEHIPLFQIVAQKV